MTGDTAAGTAHSIVRERLRREIYQGTRQPGSRLVQTDLAVEYGVSATPVREAMRDLVNEGLITADPHKAARVRDLNVSEAVEINDLRLLLEPFAAERATPHLSASELDHLDDLAAEMRQATSSEKWVELNHAFHVVVIEATRSPNLISILMNLRMLSRFYFEAALRADGGNYAKRNAEHERLINHFRNRDAEAARAVMESHFSPSSELRRRLTMPSD